MRCLTAGKAIIDGDDRKNIAFAIEEPTLHQLSADCRFPPENTLAVASGRFHHDAVHLIEEVALALRRLRKRARMLDVIAGLPVVSCLHEVYVFAVLADGSFEIGAKIVEASMPPGVIGLADDVELNVITGEFVEEVFCPRGVASAINVNHDRRVRLGSASRGYSVYPRFHQLGEVIPVLRQLAVRP